MDHLFLVIHTHWDREWYQPFQQMRARLVAMTDAMLPLVESGKLPHFHFDGQTIVLDDYLEIRPENRARLAKLIKAGKLAVGPWYVLADSFLVSGEALIRNLEIGMASARRFGRPLDAGYLPDQFGHIAQMPQILAGFGFKTAVLWRGVPRNVDRNRFMWEAPDGSRVLTAYLPFGYSNGAYLQLDSAEALLQRAKDIASRERPFAAGMSILVMNGTDHTPPDARLMERIAEAAGRDDLSFEIGRLEDYLKRLSAAPMDAVPTHRGELRSPSRAHLLPGVTSARTWIKQRDFANCMLLERYADPLAALASALGRGEDLRGFLDLAWRTELQNHPHDSICGCSIDQVHEDMRYRFDQAAMIGETVVRKASRALLGSDGAGEPMLAVFNPTFSREAVVSGEVKLPRDAYYAIDSAGNRSPLAIEYGATRSHVTFVAKDLTQGGFSFYRLAEYDRTVERPRTDDPGIENEFYRLEVGPRGLHILDKESGQTLELYFEDDGDRGDEYNFDPVGDGAAITQPNRVTVEGVEQTEGQPRMHVRCDFSIPVALTSHRDGRESECRPLEARLTATVYTGLRRIEFFAEVQNSSLDHRFRVALRTPVRTPEAISDTSFGIVRRPQKATEPRGTETIYPTFPRRSITMVESEALSVALASRGLYEVEARPEEGGTTMLLTLLRCVGKLSRSDLATRDGGAGPELDTPGAQEIGRHSFQFAVTTYRGGHLAAGVMPQMVTYAVPPRVFSTRAPSPDVATLQLFSCDNPHLMFSTARLLDRGTAYVARAFSISPDPETARFSFGVGGAARLVDLAVRPLLRRKIDRKRDGSVEVKLRPFEIVTLRVARKKVEKI